MVRDTDHQRVDRRKFLAASAGVGAATFAGCLGGDEGVDDDGTDDDGTDDTGADDGDDFEEEDDLRDIMLGILMPETGDLGSLGVGIRDGARLAPRQLEGEIDFNLDIATGDTQTDPQAGISEADSLVDAGYPAIVGPAASNVNLQVTRQSFIPNQVVGMSPSSTAPAVTDLDDDDYIFRTAISDALQGPVAADFAMEEFGAETAGTLFLNDDYGQALEESFVNAFEGEGGEALNRVSFEPEQPSYTSQLDEALDDEPDFLFVVGFPQSGIQLFRDYYDAYQDEVELPIVVTDGLIDNDLPEEVGNSMENVWGTAPAAAGPGAEQFAEMYEEEWGESPGPFVAGAYDAAAVLILANAAAGENDGTAIRDNIRPVSDEGGTEVTIANLAEGVELAAAGEEVEYRGASSDIVFDENGDVASADYDIFRVEDGSFVVQRVVSA